MRAPAEHFLSLRAFGAPPIVIALAAQGTFRGFKDTKTPLYATGKFLGIFNCCFCQMFLLIDVISPYSFVICVNEALLLTIF